MNSKSPLCRFAVLAALGVLSIGCNDAARGLPAAGPTQFPALVDLEGNELRPFARADVKAVALIFVLPDCPIANAYVPEINRLHEEFRSQGVELVIVQADPATTAEQARKHAREYEIKLPVIVDADHAWVRRAEATRTPEAVVFSSAGEIVYRGRIDDRYVGLGRKRSLATRHELRDALTALVSGQRVAAPQTEAVGCYIPELAKGK